MVYRCEWSNYSELMRDYHDREWGVPQHDDKKLFEFLVLEGVQAGLNWNTILQKRENYRKVLENFDYEKIAKYEAQNKENLMNNNTIIRNQSKINAIIENAKAILIIQKEFGSFDKYIWQFVDYKPVINQFRNLSEIPAKSLASEKMSKGLKKWGFKFVGPTICYAFMQAVGMVNDHIMTCFRYNEINNPLRKE